MKSNRWMTASVLGGLLILAASCVKEKADTTGGVPGSRIVFSAAASYENSDETRTEYSGAIYGATNRIERIDWVKDVDKLTVHYKHGSATDARDFLVTSVSPSSYNSDAEVEELGDVLRWAEGNSHAFYAMYPTHEVNPNAVLSGNHFQGTLYPAQNQTHQKDVTVNGKTWARWLPDMNYAYMVAYAGTNPAYGISGNNVTLPFRPAVTTFEFRLRREVGETGANIRQFQLISEGHALTGTFSFDINGGDARGATWGTVSVPAKTASNSVITVDFGAAGAALPAATEDKYLDFTIFALPVNLDDLSIKIVYTNGVSRLMPLKDKNASGQYTSYHTFLGAKKYVFTNSHVPGDDWIYTLEATPSVIFAYSGETKNYSVSSYRTLAGGNVREPVSWNITRYSVDGGTNWTSGKPSWLTLAASGSGSETGESKTATATANNTARPKEWLGPKTVVGNDSRESSYRLSLYDIFGNPLGSHNTANCYVVSKPGWFEFPLVYGNALKNGVENTGAYQTGNTGANMLKDFIRHDGNPIVSPYLLVNVGSNMTAEVAWQDFGTEVITNVSTIGTDGAQNWSVTFYVEPSRIKQGNALIVVKNEAGEVVWSWHIWIIEQQKLYTKTVRSDNGPMDVLSMNLGWYDADRIFEPRSVLAEVTQAESNQKAIIEFYQGTDHVFGGNVYYQWGRKDPMLGFDENFNQKSQTGTMLFTTAPVGVTAGSNSTHTPPVLTTTLQDGIKHPNVFYFIDTDDSDGTPAIFDDGAGGKTETMILYDGRWQNKRYDNLWNRNAVSAPYYDDPGWHGQTTGTVPESAQASFMAYLEQVPDTPVVKTVYDPCPVGFKIPSSRAFRYMKSDYGTLRPWHYGETYKTSTDDTQGLFFPCTSLREFNGGTVRQWDYGGYYIYTAGTHLHRYGALWMYGGNYLEVRDTPAFVPTAWWGCDAYGYSVRPVAE